MDQINLNQTTNRRPQGVLLILAFMAVYIIWGTTYLAIRYTLSGMTPFISNALRYTLVSALLLAWAGIRRLSFPSWKNARVLALSGLLMLCGGTGLVAVGEQYINSGATAVIIATEPLMFLLFDRKNKRAYSVLTLTGIFLGFAGIFLFSRFTNGGGDALRGAAGVDVVKGTVLVLISAVFWTLGTLVARSHAGNNASPVSNVAIQHIAGAVAAAIIALFNGDWAHFNPAQVPGQAWGGLAYLVVMGSLVAFMAFMWLVKVMPPAIVSTHTYVNPIVAVIAGWIMVGETINVAQLLALGMVLVGVLLVQTPRERLPKFLTRNARINRRPHSEPWS
jgi:drug/metabolite transporter (DMT)-like permease